MVFVRQGTLVCFVNRLILFIFTDLIYVILSKHNTELWEPIMVQWMDSNFSEICLINRRVK